MTELSEYSTTWKIILEPKPGNVVICKVDALTKANFTLEQGMNDQSGSRGIVLLFL